MEWLARLWDALILAAAMAWQVGWSLVLGFTLSGLVQAVVSPERMRARLGADGPRQIALATIYGAASSSCSYAAAALSRRLFLKGAGFRSSLAFLFASTNLVVELGLLLYVLMGWQFTAAEWIGGLVLVGVMSLLVTATYPRALIAEARIRAGGAGHEHDADTVVGATLWDKLRNPETRVVTARIAAMDWSMLRGDLGLGFVVAALIAEFVPPGAFHALVVPLAPLGLGTPLAAAAGALLAIVTFVCSIGNVPMAAILWASGLSFAGVLAFLYADLLVFPLLDVYRKYYGLRMTAYIFAVFFVTIVIGATVIDAAFGALHAIPRPVPDIRVALERFSFDATFWLNLVALIVVGYGWSLNRRHPGEHACAMHAGDGAEERQAAPAAEHAEHCCNHEPASAPAVPAAHVAGATLPAETAPFESPANNAR